MHTHVQRSEALPPTANRTLGCWPIHRATQRVIRSALPAADLPPNQRQHTHSAHGECLLGACCQRVPGGAFVLENWRGVFRRSTADRLHRRQQPDRSKPDRTLETTPRSARVRPGCLHGSGEGAAGMVGQ